MALNEILKVSLERCFYWKKAVEKAINIYNEWVQQNNNHKDATESFWLCGKTAHKARKREKEQTNTQVQMDILKLGSVT